MATADRVQAFVGLAVRSRAVALGREACKRAARNGTLRALVLASDAGASAARDSGAGPEVQLVRVALDKRALGALVGREQLAAMGITNPDLAAGLIQAAHGTDI